MCCRRRVDTIWRRHQHGTNSQGRRNARTARRKSHPQVNLFNILRQWGRCFLAYVCFFIASIKTRRLHRSVYVGHMSPPNDIIRESTASIIKCFITGVWFLLRSTALLQLLFIHPPLVVFILPPGQWLAHSRSKRASVWNTAAAGCDT